jgi:hypothetical protein
MVTCEVFLPLLVSIFVASNFLNLFSPSFFILFVLLSQLFILIFFFSSCYTCFNGGLKYFVLLFIHHDLHVTISKIGGFYGFYLFFNRHGFQVI